MTGFWENIRKSILSGAMIAIGGIVYLSIDNSFIGSIMFSFGLLTILYKGLNLYTGKVGYVKKLSDIPPLLVTLLGNAIGLSVIAVIYRSTAKDLSRVTAICQNKLDNDWWKVFLLAFMCGIMMYLAVSLFRENRVLVLVTMAISIFIMSGFEHSIASMFYFVSGLGIEFFSLKPIIYILIMVLGNAAGSLAFRAIEVKNRS